MFWTVPHKQSLIANHSGSCAAKWMLRFRWIVENIDAYIMIYCLKEKGWTAGTVIPFWSPNLRQCHIPLLISAFQIKKLSMSLHRRQAARLSLCLSRSQNTRHHKKAKVIILKAPLRLISFNLQKSNALSSSQSPALCVNLDRIYFKVYFWWAGRHWAQNPY